MVLRKTAPTCVAVFGHSLVNLSDQIVMFVEELGVLSDIGAILVDAVQVIFAVTEILDQRLVPPIVNFELDEGTS